MPIEKCLKGWIVTGTPKNKNMNKKRYTGLDNNGHTFCIVGCEHTYNNRELVVTLCNDRGKSVISQVERFEYIDVEETQDEKLIRLEKEIVKLTKNLERSEKCVSRKDEALSNIKNITDKSKVGFFGKRKIIESVNKLSSDGYYYYYGSD